jgi:hypothetical protein
MSPDELAAIRARVAAIRARDAMYSPDSEVVMLTTSPGRDRRALLAEVDRLAADLAAERARVERVRAAARPENIYRALADTDQPWGGCHRREEVHRVSYHLWLALDGADHTSSRRIAYWQGFNEGQTEARLEAARMEAKVDRVRRLAYYWISLAPAGDQHYGRRILEELDKP